MEIKFREYEVVRVQGKDHVTVGGRLRVAHEVNAGKISIETEVLDYALGQYAVVRAKVTTTGQCTATGTAESGRDPKLADSLLELAETRAIARALRFAGFGVECCGAEEVDSETASNEGRDDRSHDDRKLRPVRSATGGSKPIVPATSAQLRALETVARREGTDTETLLKSHLSGVSVVTLTLQQASELISNLRARESTRATEQRR